jgi:hypothetical protein
MANKASRKELLRAYRDEKQTGGVYAIRNAETGKALLLSTLTISKAANLLDFSKTTGSCVNPLVADDWARYGPAAFKLEILETLDRKETQSDGEFADDIKALESLWREKLGPAEVY